MSKIASTVLMIRPASFGFNAETAANNVFQNSIPTLTQKEIQQKAIGEFDNFIATLRANDIDVIVVEDTPEPQKPDAVFPNNWFCSLPDGTVAVFPMFAANRRIEKRNDLVKMLGSNYKVKDVEDWSKYEAENLFLEGTGSMLIDHDTKIIYACISPRTDNTLLEKFAKEHGYKAVAFHSKDENGKDIYHTNVIMHLGEDYAVVSLDSIQNDAERKTVSEMLVGTGHEIIPITLQQVYAFAGNMLQIKNKKGARITILSTTSYESLMEEQKQILERHTKLLPLDISTIETIGGGSVRCMMAEIFLEKIQ
jgi:hypothetical protein